MNPAPDTDGMKADNPFDVIIVGAGLGGLSGAYHLRHRKILILEASDRPGGRIQTRRQRGVTYELGAVFGFDPNLLPFQEPGLGAVDESEHVGLVSTDTQGRPLLAREVFSCLKPLGDPQVTLHRCRRFLQDPEASGDELPPSLYQALNAFFQVIHPGELRDAAFPRRQDALVAYPTSHARSGHGALIQSLLRQGNLLTRLRCGTEVQTLADEGPWVRVDFGQGGRMHRVYGRAVIVTATAARARRMVPGIRPSAARFLDALRYEPGIVVALGCRGALPDFGYLVTPEAPMNTLLQQRSAGRNHRMVLAYYLGRKARAVQPLADEALTHQVLATLRGMGYPVRARFGEVARWPEVGPVLSPEVIAAWSPDCDRLTSRVFLGGEAAWFDPRDPMPYGLQAAWLAGQRAAARAESLLGASS